MKRLLFGPTNSTGIFHHEVSKAFTGLEGCITIHDNILVYEVDEADHNRHMKGMLERASERGVTLKLSKSTVCAVEVKWFVRAFSAAGVLANPDKIEHIKKDGPPVSIKEIRSELQAAAYNARFSFGHNEDDSYEEVIATLRQMLEKDVRFKWEDTKDQAYRQLLRMMNSDTYLVLLMAFTSWGDHQPLKLGLYHHETGPCCSHGQLCRPDDCMTCA